MRPIVRNINTNDLYSWDGELFCNLRTKESGKVSDEAARKTFRINLEATDIIAQYPLVEKMINVLKLKIDTNGLVSMQG